MTITGLREPAQLRVIHASADAPPMDLYLDDAGLAYNLAFASRTSYIPVEEGRYELQAELAGSRQILRAAPAAFSGGGRYTAIVGDGLGHLQLTVLPDRGAPAAPGQAAVRVVNEAARTGPLDLYLVPSGSSLPAAPVLPNLSFGTVAHYRSVTAGSYSLLALPAGTNPDSATASLFTSPQMIWPSGSVRTLVLLDRAASVITERPGVQAVVSEEEHGGL